MRARTLPRWARSEPLRRAAALATLAFSLTVGVGCKEGPAATEPGTEPAPTPAAAATPGATAAAGPGWRPGYRRPLVIDFHGHIRPSGLSRLAQTMADNGLALMVNLSGGSPGAGLEASVAMQRHFPGIVHFYNPAWKERDRPGFGVAEAKRLREAVTRSGFKGLKISKALGLYLDTRDGKRIPVDWPELDPLWEEAGKLGVPVSIHTGDPKAFWQPVTPDNERYEELAVHPSWSFAGPEFPSREQLLAERDRVLERHRGTTFVCVHFGNNPEDLDYVDKLLDRHPNAVLDTAARLGEIGRHPADQVRAFFTKHKARILFGTDLGMSARGIMLGSGGAVPPTMADVKPFYDAHWRFFEGSEAKIAHPTPIQGRWTIDAIGLPDDVLDHLYFKNAERLLNLVPRLDAGAPAAP